jgi:parallel beta-helix repeat protein
MKTGYVKKGLVVGIILLFVGVSVIPSMGVNIVKRYFPDDVKTSFTDIKFGGYIQDLIDNASDGDTIYIPNGTYYENIIINKSISLVGEDKNTTIIDGGGEETVVSIAVDWVNISGFTIQNSGYNSLYEAGIEIFSNHNTIIGNTISNNNLGILLDYSSGNNITGNIMVGDGILIQGYMVEHWNTHNIDTSNIVNGKPVIYWKNQNGGTIPSGAGQVILANCSNVVVENLNISGGDVGIELGFSSGCTIIGNSIISNNIFAIHLDDSHGNNITGNTISSNIERGIYLYDSHSNNITGNTISNNNDGIHLWYSNGNNITGNTISNNNDGIYLTDSSVNIIIGNNISNNNLGILLVESRRNSIIGNNISLDNYGGIYLSWNSGKNIISGNTFFNDGIYIKNSYDNNVENNTVNGKLLVYLEDESDKVIDYDAGQLILLNCDNITVNNQDIYQTNIGIQLYNTNNCLISNNYISLNKDCGIYLENSSRNTIIGNTIISNNWSGISFSESNNNTIKNNNISNYIFGLDIHRSCYNNIVSNKIIFNNDTGIISYYSNFNFICGNIISNNGDGIRYFKCNKDTVTNNNISNNDFGVDLGESYTNIFYKNNFINKYRQVVFYNCKNIWLQNYWNRPRILPKLIFGKILLDSKEIPCINIDWFPARKPYEITTTQGCDIV